MAKTTAQTTVAQSNLPLDILNAGIGLAKVSQEGADKFFKDAEKLFGETKANAEKAFGETKINVEKAISELKATAEKAIADFQNGGVKAPSAKA